MTGGDPCDREYANASRFKVLFGGDGCGPSVLGPSSGTLSSLDNPRTYPSDTVCEWEITVPRGKIHFRFALLDLGDSDCQVNYLRLYNGIGSKKTEIVKYCGLDQKVDELIESSGNQVTVQFRSVMHRTGRGFYLSYSTTEHSALEKEAASHRRVYMTFPAAHVILRDMTAMTVKLTGFDGEMDGDLITCLDKGSDFPEAEFRLLDIYREDFWNYTKWIQRGEYCHVLMEGRVFLTDGKTGRSAGACASGSEAPHRNRGGAGSLGKREIRICAVKVPSNSLSCLPFLCSSLQSSPLCVAAIHAGAVSNAAGGKITVVSSTGIPHYEATLANNVTSTVGILSKNLFTFKTDGCSGTLGLESGGVVDSQLSVSSVWDWNTTAGEHVVWGKSGARLKKPGLPWAPSLSDRQQWLQVDFRREKRITAIVTTGSDRSEYQYFVKAYRVLFSKDGKEWHFHRETNSSQDKIFQGNMDYQDKVRNNFIPPIEARFVRINPTLWNQRIALKLELFGCLPGGGRSAVTKLFTTSGSGSTPPPAKTKHPPHLSEATHTPDIRNTTMPPHCGKDVVLMAVLVPVAVVVLTALILTVACVCHWRNKKKSAEGTYDIPYWDRTVWWKSMKQLLPSKMMETEDSVRYSTPEVSRLAGRSAVPRLHAEPAEYAQPLVSGVPTLGARSTFKPDEGPEPGYSDPDLYDAPIPPDVYHPYAEPLPSSGAEYATPIVVDMGCHLPSKVLNFMGSGPGSLLTWTDSSHSGGSVYDTPKNANGQTMPTQDLTYQVPQKVPPKPAG
ncbi:discoidin, CUB and LCCL domain-containing protein 2 [Xiphophorus maculatus]|uniref:discoidin, CUB and LCCL domain-containing protein 2 n=1 Tax=Xiphophorus maculatus TaxID=8083 RepID=UPI000C6DF674|nr:discoidin, CUB and LCCL domain-containing protein 2 [Xiphophorus maculatus]